LPRSYAPCDHPIDIIESLATARGGGAGIREGPLELECHGTVLHAMLELEKADLLQRKFQMDYSYLGDESPGDKPGGESVK
jgi:hypothetical protein